MRIGLFMAAVLFAGCAAGALSVEEAGARYLDVAAAYNTILTTAEDAFNAGPQDLASSQAYWTTMAAAEQAFLDGVKAIRFPESVQRQAQALIDTEAILLARSGRAATAADEGEMLRRTMESREASATAADAAAVLRAALNLGPNP